MADNQTLMAKATRLVDLMRKVRDELLEVQDLCATSVELHDRVPTLGVTVHELWMLANYLHARVQVIGMAAAKASRPRPTGKKR